MSRISIIEATADYLIINKPSGVRCHGTFDRNCLLPQLTSHFKQLDPNRKVDPTSFKVVQRLDRFVTGGLVVSRNQAFARKYSGWLKSRTNLKRQYIGLIPIPDSYTNFRHYLDDECKYKVDSGDKGLVLDLERSDSKVITGAISFDISLLEKDTQKHKEKTFGRNYTSLAAFTRFKVREDLVFEPNTAQKKKYAQLYAHKLMVPLLLELETGRKNQIRDHVLQAFGTTLLNDDHFEDFKRVSAHAANVNSSIFCSNQIGLHSFLVSFGGKSRLFPVLEPDRILWGDILEDGRFPTAMVKLAAK